VGFCGFGMPLGFQIFRGSSIRLSRRRICSSELTSSQDFACGTSSSTARRCSPAFSSWRDPRTTLSRMSSPTSTAVETSPIAKLGTATSMIFIGSRRCPSATCHTDGGASRAIPFAPTRASRERGIGRAQPGVRVRPEPRRDVRGVARAGRCIGAARHGRFLQSHGRFRTPSGDPLAKRAPVPLDTRGTQGG
jgi:hypothetical protein